MRVVNSNSKTPDIVGNGPVTELGVSGAIVALKSRVRSDQTRLFAPQQNQLGSTPTQFFPTPRQRI